MASPNVAGVAALIRSYYPNLKAAQVKQIIMQSGTAINFDVVVGKTAQKIPFSKTCVSGKLSMLTTHYNWPINYLKNQKKSEIVIQIRKVRLPFLFFYPMKNCLLLSVLLLSTAASFAQSSSYWQQQVDYKMNVTMNVKNYQYQGNQELVYTNNSPDTLRRVYYHLYNNAFQPGSEMDARLQSIADPDSRMVNRIKNADGSERKESVSLR